MQTGLIGYLRADFGSNGNEFWTTWNDFRKDLKTDEFKAEFDDVINGLRDGDVLSGRKSREMRYIRHRPLSNLRQFHRFPITHGLPI